MTRTELIIQLLKLVIGLAFGAYFVWWSLEVLDRLTPEDAVTGSAPAAFLDDDFDVLCNGEVVGRIYKANAAPVGEPWMWTLIFPHHEGRTPTHGYAATREAGMAAFKSWCLKQLPEAVIEKTKNEIGGARGGSLYAITAPSQLQRQ
jgi:hypothetical protein